MSSAAGAVTRAAAPVLNPIQETAGSFLEGVGVSDPSTRGGIAGGLAGSLLPGPLGPGSGSALGFFQGQKQGEAVEQARDAAAESEAARRRFNEDIFRLAESISGSVAQNPEFAFQDVLQFRGDDPRQEQLNQLVNLFSRRAGEVQEQRFSPGISQTRLSLVD